MTMDRWQDRDGYGSGHLGGVVMAASANDESRYVPAHPVRFVTSTALFDGHDAAINIMRRILQAQGAEGVHLGHDPSVREVSDAGHAQDAHGARASAHPDGHEE